MYGILVCFVHFRASHHLKCKTERLGRLRRNIKWWGWDIELTRDLECLSKLLLLDSDELRHNLYREPEASKLIAVVQFLNPLPSQFSLCLCNPLLMVTNV